MSVLYHKVIFKECDDRFEAVPNDASSKTLCSITMVVVPAQDDFVTLDGTMYTVGFRHWMPSLAASTPVCEVYVHKVI